MSLVDYTDDGKTLSAVLRSGEVLFRYVYQPDMPAEHAPRPYFHPINTLSGMTLTAIQPPDHPWHYGLSLAVPDIDGASFWGGGTYIHGQGYVDLPNHGCIEHIAWDAPTDNTWTEHLRWIAPGGETLLEETRRIHTVISQPQVWRLELTFSLFNVSGRMLECASPAVRGRAGAGYGGLFFRADSALRSWIAKTGSAVGEDAVHGSRSGSLTWADPQGNGTILFHDHPGNPGFPTCWFFRQHEYPGVCFPLAFESALMLPPQTPLTLNYAITLNSVPKG